MHACAHAAIRGLVLQGSHVPHYDTHTGPDRAPLPPPQMYGPPSPHLTKSSRESSDSTPRLFSTKNDRWCCLTAPTTTPSASPTRTPTRCDLHLTQSISHVGVIRTLSNVPDYDGLTNLPVLSLCVLSQAADGAHHAPHANPHQIAHTTHHVRLDIT